MSKMYMMSISYFYSCYFDVWNNQNSNKDQFNFAFIFNYDANSIQLICHKNLTPTHAWETYLRRKLFWGKRVKTRCHVLLMSPD